MTRPLASMAGHAFQFTTRTAIVANVLRVTKEKPATRKDKVPAQHGLFIEIISRS